MVSHLYGSAYELSTDLSRKSVIHIVGTRKDVLRCGLLSAALDWPLGQTVSHSVRNDKASLQCGVSYVS